MASVTFDHVTKKFGETVAVDDLNIQVDDREFLVLVGPSGCGKTTALRCLAGLEEVTNGRIMIGDRVVNDVAPKDRDIAMVFQSYALYPHLSVFDNMAFGLKLRKVPKDQIKARVEKAASTLGITDLLKRRPRQLSGGQRQRVAVGRAIVREPKVFLFDEPLSNLDAKLRVQMRAEISKIHHQLQTTFIYVTHDQMEAMTMATRIAVITQGQAAAAGYAAELVQSTGESVCCRVHWLTGHELLPSDHPLQWRAGGGQRRVPDPDSRRAGPRALEAYAGKEVVMGIRPEDIHDLQFVPPNIASATTDSPGGCDGTDGQRDLAVPRDRQEHIRGPGGSTLAIAGGKSG